MAYALRLYARYVKTLPAHVDRDAVRGAALEGLVKASRSYDAETNVPFKNWAARRVIGQMRDEMRSQDHLSRRMRERVQHDQEARLSPLLAASESPLSLDEEVGMCSIEGAEVVTYNDVVSDKGVGQDEPWEERSRLSEREVHELMAALSEREFKVVVMRYYDGMLVSDVARVLALSESRVNQLETKALKTMREALPEAA